MNTPQLKQAIPHPYHRLPNIQVNISLPHQLHTIHPLSPSSLLSSTHPNTHHHPPPFPEEQIQPITQSPLQQPSDSPYPHKIRHIDSIDDKGEFIDQKRHSRVSEKDQLVELVSRANCTGVEQEGVQGDGERLELIEEEGHGNQVVEGRQLKHLSVQQDRDEFNLASSRSKQSKDDNSSNCKRKRRLSQSNLPSYSQAKSHFSLSQYLTQQQKRIPTRIQKIIEQEAQCNDRKQKPSHYSPLRRDRRQSVHSVHGGSSPRKRLLRIPANDRRRVGPEEEGNVGEEGAGDARLESVTPADGGDPGGETIGGSGQCLWLGTGQGED